MRYLLDTHCLIWFLQNDFRLSERIRKLIENLDSVKLISAATGWEIAIKSNIGKLQLPLPYNELYPSALENLGFTILPIEARHLHAFHILPNHHRDPFDRILVAQAQSENIPLLSSDPQLSRYDANVIW